MSGGPAERYDFFLSRRGSVAAVAREVENALGAKGYRVLTQDYDIPLGASFIEKMHEAVSNSRDLVILFTHDYLDSPYTRREFTSFEAERAQSQEERHIIVLRCEDVPLRGLLADNVYQDLVGVVDSEERRRRIVAAAERQSQATPPPPRPFIGVPPRIASFTGRADELDRLDAILMQDKPAAVTQASVGRAAVQGMGGVGKTSLAIEYAHRFRGLYGGVCWCPSETRTGLLSTLASLAVTLCAATAEEADVEKASKAALSRLAAQRATWLLVYDNVPEPKHIVELLPSAGARVLITSRFSDWSELADEVALDVLPLEEARAFLQSRAARSDAAGAGMLAEALGGLPLALDHAAAYCKRTQMRFANYAEKASNLISTAPRGVGYPRSVAATFDLAIAEAVQQCSAAEALMTYLAQCAPERIPIALVEGAVEDDMERMKAIAALAEISLMKHDPFADGTQAVTVHRLVQAVARARSQTNGSAESAVRRLIARLIAIYPDGAYLAFRSWPLCAKLTPHVLALRDARAGITSEIADWPDLLDRAGTYLFRHGAFSQVTDLSRDALVIREKALGPEHPTTVRSLGMLATALSGQGDLASAQALFERVLEIYERELGPEHPDTADSRRCLAEVLHAQGDLARARPLVERALAIEEKMPGGYAAPHLDLLAMVLRDQGDLAGATPFAQRALEIREKVLGPENPETGRSLLQVADLRHAQGDHAGARPLVERALEIHAKVFGPTHQDTNRTRCHLAELLLRSNQPTQALALAETALSTDDKALGRAHPWTQDSARVTADALEALGRTDEAKELRERYALLAAEK
jgi:tetratricopeptide (TPR) repeat protein